MKTILFNPFQKYSENILIVVGITVTLLGSFLGFVFSVRFDGVLDLHFVSETLLWQPLSDNIINIICLSLFLLVLSKYINKKTRVIDIFIVAALARWPYYVLTLFNINGLMKQSTETIMQSIAPGEVPNIPSGTLITILIFSIFSLTFLVWYIALLFNGFKVSSNAKGTLPVVLFVVCIILAEIVSKFLIYKFG